MEASRLRTLMKKSRLLPQALCFLSLFLILGIQGYAQTCDDMTTGIGGSLNGFLPFQNTTATLYGPAAWNYQVYNVGTSTMTTGVTIDPNSDAIIAQINHGDKIGGKPAPLHPDFGPAGGMPYTIVDSSVQPSVNLYGLKAGPPGPDASQSDAVVEPAPANAPIEGQQPNCLSYPSNGEGENYYFGDTHMIIVDRNQCFLYETYLTSECDGVISAGGQAIWDLQNGEVRPYGWTSTDAAGLPVWPGLVKYDEAATGVINHAFRFTVNRTKGDSYFVFPAGHGASGGYNFKYLNVMGMRMILNPTTDISSFSTMNQTILTAMMQYGLILADNGSDMYVTGTTDSRWSTDDLGNWHGGGPLDCGNPSHNVGDPCYLTSADFEVIQMSPENVNATDLASGNWTAAQSESYMDSASAPYTVADVEAGITADGDPGDPNAPTPSGTAILGGLGPNGTSLDPASGGKYPAETAPEGTTSGPAPVINNFEAQYTIFGIPIGGNLCGTTIASDPGLTIAFRANITGSTYQYVDNAGPFRVDGAGFGLVYSTISNSQDYTLYAMNSYGMIESSACTLYIGEGILPIPVLSPTTGTYNNIISVTISDPGYPGATIFYTTDETQPDQIGGVPQGTTQIYTGAIVITGTTPDLLTYLPGEQINAIAVDADFAAPSAVGLQFTLSTRLPPRRLSPRPAVHIPRITHR